MSKQTVHAVPHEGQWATKLSNVDYPIAIHQRKQMPLNTVKILRKLWEQNCLFTDPMDRFGTGTHMATILFHLQDNP